jgi:hypothetical protein
VDLCATGSWKAWNQVVRGSFVACVIVPAVGWPDGPICTLMELESVNVNQAKPITSAARTAEPVGPARLHQGSLTLTLSAVQPR